MPTIVMSNIEEFYNRYVDGKMKAGDTNEQFAARSAYQTATKRAVVFPQNYSKKVLKKVREKCESWISNFLLTRNFDRQTIERLAKQIRDEYHSEGFVDWTIGNSQKWINMAIKYLFVIEVHNKPSLNLVDTIDDWNYELFPVDGIMIGIIKKDLNLKFADSWSKCDNYECFENYWSEVNKYCKKNGTRPLLYEILNWKK